MSGKMSTKEFIRYIIAQVLGALAGSSVLAFVNISSTSLEGFGANGFGSFSAVGLTMAGAIVVEVVLTFIFVLTILGVTSSNKTSHMAGIVIGLTLTLVHIIGIPLTSKYIFH